MKNDEIRAANRKALPKFLLLTLVGAVIGGIAGYCAARYGLDQLSGVLADAGAFFGARIAPWLMVAVAVITPAVCIPLYRRAKALLASWDGEDEDVSSVIDGKLSAVLWASSASLVLAFFLIAATYSVGFASFDSWESTVFIFIGIGGCFVPHGTDRLFQKGVAFHDTLSGSMLACAGIDLGGSFFFAKSKLLSTGFCLVGIG